MPLLTQQGTDLSQQFIPIEGLGDEIVCSGFDAPNPVLMGTKRCKQNDWDQYGFTASFQNAAHRKTVYLRHHHIQKDEVGLMLLYFD